uniref:Uncharacterized protein n=1 Tax=Anguilla anguilla TaxID=7936 RepID=A0A0E9W503_ANGAN
MFMKRKITLVTNIYRRISQKKRLQLEMESGRVQCFTVAQFSPAHLS